MTNIIYNMSASLDGYVRAPGHSAEASLGIGGKRLHE
jgi:hypothetical protein